LGDSVWRISGSSVPLSLKWVVPAAAVLVEFRKFLAKIDSQVPEGLDVHLICDNYQTHKTPVVKTWLQKHPRFHMHFTPTYSSWLNQV
jgi:transposase